MNIAVIQHQIDRSPSRIGRGSEMDIEITQQRHKVTAVLSGAGDGMDLSTAFPVDAENVASAGLAWCGKAQVSTWFGPHAAQIGMAADRRFILVQQRNDAFLCPPLQDAQPLLGLGNRFGVLEVFGCVPRSSVGVPPFFLMMTLSQDSEIVSPVRFLISRCNRGTVQGGWPWLGSANNSWITGNTASAKRGGRPGLRLRRKPATPCRRKAVRQWRMRLGTISNNAPISSLMRPSSVQTMARARSASPRWVERANSSSSRLCASVTGIFHGFPTHLPSRTGRYAKNASNFQEVCLGHRSVQMFLGRQKSLQVCSPVNWDQESHSLQG